MKEQIEKPKLVNKSAIELKIISIIDLVIAIAIFYPIIINIEDIIEIIIPRGWEGLFAILAFIVSFIVLIFFLILLSLGILYILLSYALWKGKRWAIKTQLILSIILVPTTYFEIYYLSTIDAKMLQIAFSVVQALIAVYLMYYLRRIKNT